MAAERLCMRQIRNVFRLRLLENKSHSEIALHLGIGKTTVHDYLHRLNKSGLSSWTTVEALDDVELEKRLGFSAPFYARKENAMPDWAYVHRELQKRHVTLALLWTEYREQNPGGYGHTQFNEHYNRWRGKLSVVMRQAHRAGEKTFIDYSGDGLWLNDPATGERQRVELFVAALGASSYIYAEATASQRLSDWVSSHVRMSEYFGGVSEIWVPDNLKSGVNKHDKYEPLINETYRECASHYGACVIPARAGKPKDKAKVEVSVQVAQRWILARLRGRLFTSLSEMNEAIWECLEIINNRKMRHLNKSRRELFEEVEKPALKALPTDRYQFAEWKKVTVNIDYHITFDHHRYSVPYQLVHESCDVRATATTLEIFRRGKRIASHRRSYRRGGYTTLREHMPKGHREHAEWTPERVIRWAKQIGPSTSALVEKILSMKIHPQQGFMAALGLIRLEKPYGKARVERASAKALEVGAHSYQFVKQMLKNNMDGAGRSNDESPMAEQKDPVTNEIQLALLSTENIRGSGYYH
ncbi:MAG: IS21 family transposase [Bdellovibrionaceae bacterium]|nr:IS21 family transposase [Pseudobdellovibrionaceae bacterium]